MAQIEDKIRQYGQKRDIKALQTLIESLDNEELAEIISTKLTNPNFSYTWNYILQGFTETRQSQQKRNDVIIKTLKEIDSNELSISQTNAIVHRICMDLAKFSGNHLVELCNYSIDVFQKQRATQMSWKELLPELMNVIAEIESIEVDGVEMRGTDYKHQIIGGICVFQWSPEIITPVTSMFIDMPLSKEEHIQVVNKLGQFIEKLTPQEIPPFVYQLLRLCKNNNSKIIFFRLQHYFGIRIYETLSPDSESSSDNTNFDAIESASNQEVIEAESTVLYHIHAIASLGHESIKNYLNSLKNLYRAPEFVLHPFQITVLLTISTYPHYEEKIFDILKACISKSYHEEQKRSNSAWFREMVAKTYQVEAAFAQIINLSSENRDLVLQGLVNFAFLLLGVGAGLGKDVIAEKQWNLGNIILFKIIKRKRHLAPVIIQQLSNRIITGQNVTQYIECMYMMTKNLPLLMMENRSSLDMLLEGIVQMPGNNAKLLLDAIVPLIKISPTVRDQFILLLRKALYSRHTETRQMAVIGFLKLMVNLKISNMAALSQSSFTGSFSSGHSLFTQISMNRVSQCTPSAFSNEALCLEILSILRRCFMQQAEVRYQLYEGLYDAVCQNPELGIPILDAILLHFSEFYNLDEEALPPLRFEKIMTTRDVTVILQEPIGKLLYTIGLIVTAMIKTNSENETVIKFTNILQSLCTRMAQCELVHFELDDGTDLTDIVPESQEKLVILKEAISVYDALIGYKINSWEIESENNALDISSLFRGYVRLTDCLKNINKPKKSESRKKKPVATSTQNSTVNLSGSNTTTNTTVNKKDAQSKSKLAKLNDTVFDFQVISKVMNLLYEPMVSWATSAQANEIKSNKNFNQHIMQTTINLVQLLKHRKFVDMQSTKTIFGFLCEISVIIFERIIKRFMDFIEFDGGTAILALECFLLILQVVNNQFKSNFVSFLSKISGTEKGQDISIYLVELVQTYQKIFESDEEGAGNDIEMKKLSMIIVNTLNFFAGLIPTAPNALSLQLAEWLKNYATTNTISNKILAANFTSLLLNSIIKFKVSLTLFENISVRLGDETGVISQEEHNVEEFKMINDGTLPGVWIELCNSVKVILEDIDWIIARLKIEFTMMAFPNNLSIERRKENLKTKERGVCCQLCFVVTILTNLSNCTVPIGSLFEAVLKNVTQLFCILSSLTKHFVSRSSKDEPIFQEARFEHLVKLAGKQLAPTVYKLILYMEESQKEENQGSKKKNTSNLKTKVLKETRLIPKVVYEIEQFSKCVTLLSNKTKIDLARSMGQGTVRDFRILHLREVLEKTDGSTQGSVTASSINQSNESDVEEGGGEEEEDEEPPSKKSRD